MGIGVVEILIVVVILLIVFGGYRRLPQLGRSAGTGARRGGEKAKELAGQVRSKAEEVDTAKVGDAVGKGIREAREVRDSVQGIADSDETAPKREKPPPADAPAAAPEREPEGTPEREPGGTSER